ncbi:MAG: hypothetical protein DMF93_20625 [Acidobacteria bacterium]|nr:MAG: hypothetical protein DMF93_20625 [Acidobacteriota bacterium]
MYKTGGSYLSSDVFKVAIESGVVKYYKSGVLVYTSATAPTYPLGLDTTILSISGSITQAHITK